MPVTPSTFSGTTASVSSIGTYGFTTEELIVALYAQKGFDNILDDVTGTDQTDVLAQFIADAEQTVIVRLSQFYEPTDLCDNQWVRSRTTWIAAHLISHRRGNEHYFEDLYTQAMNELDAMATGELPPLTDIPFRRDGIATMSNFVMDDRFAIGKLRVRQNISVGATYPGQQVAFSYSWGWGWL